MDGAGELYIGYRFRQLEVREYTSKGTDDILVELYWMVSSDDAFGLLSGDWGGEAISLKPSGADAAPARAGAWPRALYGAGLLRVWSGNLYARVLSQTETDASRKAVLEIGRAIAAGKARNAAPAPGAHDARAGRPLVQSPAGPSLLFPIAPGAEFGLLSLTLKHPGSGIGRGSCHCFVQGGGAGNPEGPGTTVGRPLSGALRQGARPSGTSSGPICPRRRRKRRLRPGEAVTC